MTTNSPNNVAKCTWLIENFSRVTTKLTKKFSLPSDKKIQFELRFYPKNSSNYLPNYIFVEIYFEYDSTVVGSAQYRLSIVNIKDVSKSIIQEEQFERNSEHGRLYSHQINAYEKWISKPESGFVHNDKLTIQCEVDFKPGSSSFKIQEILHDYENHSKSFATLLESSKYSDVTFVVGGKDFKLHKNILTVSSPVFAAMFGSNLEESKRNRVEITDVDVQVFEELLRYIYSGKIQSIQQYAHELFIVSDKYQLESLKKICEQSLSSSLKTETVIATIILADMHSADHLKSKCLDFVRENAVEVKSHKDAWSQLKSRPELMMEVLDLLVDKLLSTK